MSALTLARYAASPQALADHVAGLPPWQSDLDDDPLWVRPMAELGLLRPAPLTRSADGLQITEEVVRVEPGTPLHSRQPLIRLDALLHYVQHPEVLFDPEGWLGTDLPVLLPGTGGFLVLDGNHRCAADRLCRRSTTALLARV